LLLQITTGNATTTTATMIKTTMITTNDSFHLTRVISG